MTFDEGLGAAVAGAARGEVAFPADFHGFPGTVHGGAVAACLLRLTLPRLPVRLQLSLLRGVPTNTPLRLTTTSEGHEARLALSQGDRRLVEGVLSRDSVVPPDTAPVRAAWLTRSAPLAEVPATTTCLACGAANPLGLGLRLRMTDQFLWEEYLPRPSYRARDGSAHPALATIALDELGWWLGALAQGECGVTTEITLTLLQPVPFAPLLLVGDRAAVSMDDDPRGRYCRASGYLFSASGDLVAAGSVKFAGSRAYTKRLLGPFRETTDLRTLARFFPSVRALAPAAPADAGDGVS